MISLLGARLSFYFFILLTYGVTLLTFGGIIMNNIIMAITFLSTTPYGHHRDCCITGGELVKAGDVPGDGEHHHRHNVDASGEGVHPGLHKY